MTRKHFKLIAETVSKIKNKDERRKQAELQAQICREANPRFDRQRFFAACNVS